MSKALEDIATERQRQIDVEGWTTSHDDDHGNAQLARAAAAYAIHTAAETYVDPLSRLRVQNFAKEAWPWADDWFKPGDARRNLVKAGALIAAEIERLDRSATT